MALSITMKLTEQLPLRTTLPLSSHSPHSHFSFSTKPSFIPLLKPFSSLRSSPPTTDNNTHQTNDNPQTPTPSQSKPTPSPWLNKWPPSSSSSPTSSPSQKLISKRLISKQKQDQSEGPTRTTAIERIVLRLRNLGLGDDDEDNEDEGEKGGIDLNLGSDSAMPLTGEEKLGDLLERDWVRPDMILREKGEDDDDTILPWERGRGEKEEKEERKKKAVKAPTLAELTMEDMELRRLRRVGMMVRERVNVPKAGLTKPMLEKIHDQWRKSELVRLKFHEDLAHDMKTAHEIVECRTGGLVIWRSGSVMMVFRGVNYAGPSSRSQSVEREGDSLFIPDVSSANKSNTREEVTADSGLENSKPVHSSPTKSLTEEEVEFNSLLDGLGPRFEEWWGTGILPVDADLLPQTIPGYKTPFRLLPNGMRPRLTNSEMTNLRKLARSLPCHFALGRNRNHQGLASSIIKLWDKSLIVKIAVKRGIQNTNNLLMADELKKLTGGILLLRNKYYIVMYRGKDFVPSSVAVALNERQEMTKQIQDVEEKVRIEALRGALVKKEEMNQMESAEEKVQSGAIEAASSCEEGQALAGTLVEFYEAQAKWGRELSIEEREEMIEAESKTKITRVVKRLEHKLYIAQDKRLKAEKELAKIRETWLPVGPPDDQETVTDEERVMFRRVGLRMKPYLPLGIRGVFDGVIENMHLHWKHRELVKLISKQKDIAFVEETARLLEYESGGILIDIVRVPKGYAIIYYRGKNYRRPISLRPRNLPTKAKALRRWKALQRYEALSQHVSELERGIEQIQIGDSKDINNKITLNSGDDDHFNHISKASESEDEDSWMNSDFDEDNDLDSEDDEDFQISSYEENDQSFSGTD